MRGTRCFFTRMGTWLRSALRRSLRCTLPRGGRCFRYIGRVKVTLPAVSGCGRPLNRKRQATRSLQHIETFGRKSGRRPCHNRNIRPRLRLRVKRERGAVGRPCHNSADRATTAVANLGETGPRGAGGVDLLQHSARKFGNGGLSDSPAGRRFVNRGDPPAGTERTIVCLACSFELTTLLCQAHACGGRHRYGLTGTKTADLSDGAISTQGQHHVHRGTALRFAAASGSQALVARASCQAASVRDSGIAAGDDGRAACRSGRTIHRA